MKILVTGGAGYIGSHTVKSLRDTGHQVIVVDNLATNPRYPFATDVPLIKVNIADYNELLSACDHLQFDAVMHFAAKIEVSESMQQPLSYYENNVQGLLNVAKLMHHKQCKKIIFSSTAAVYGNPEQTPITEEAVLMPINVYGRTKLTDEILLRDCAAAYGWQVTALRYFNASGASTDGQLGQVRSKHSHVIPLLILAHLENKPFKIYGTRYPTKDGTAIRDYIHVQDIADAHIRALESEHQQGFRVYNLGTGNGYSIRELISELEKIIQKPLTIIEADPRPGDPAVLIASSDKIKQELGWKPRYSDLTTILNTAYYWHKKLASQDVE